MKLRKAAINFALLHGTENWAIKATDAGMIKASEMKYLRITAGYVQSDYATNTEIGKELNVTAVLDKIQEYRRNRL